MFNQLIQYVITMITRGPTRIIQVLTSNLTLVGCKHVHSFARIVQRPLTGTHESIASGIGLLAIEFDFCLVPQVFGSLYFVSAAGNPNVGH